VNMDRIKELQPWFRGDYLVVLHDGTQLTLSRNYRDNMKDTLLKVL
jgi:two-component system LytT family response regulator